MKQIRIIKIDNNTYRFQDCENNNSIYYNNDSNDDEIYVSRLLKLIDDRELWLKNKSKIIGTILNLHNNDDCYVVNLYY